MGLTCLSFINTADLPSRILGGSFYFIKRKRVVFFYHICLFVCLLAWTHCPVLRKRNLKGKLSMYVTVKSGVVLVYRSG